MVNPDKSMTQTKVSERLAAIDVLRGFDMFFLVGAGDVLRRFFGAFESDSLNGVLYQLDHVSWTGFTAWDIIMPLFLFTSGLSMPFSFAKFTRQGHTKGQLYLKILRRFVLLFLLGWIAQGNLTDLSFNTFHVYCNTLHAIAFGYLITAVIILNVHSLKAQVAAGVSLIAAYWLCMTFIPVPGFGSGVFTPEGNLAIHIDHAVFGRFDDGTQYTWLLTSLAFAATVISGYYAGYVLKKDVRPEQKLKLLSLIGVALIAGGLLWGWQMPVIKKIWSCSMVLLSSGICYLLLALSYLLTDKLKLTGWWVDGLRIFGLNSIAAYMLHTTFRLGLVSNALLHGFEQYTGAFYPFIVALGEFGILWFIIRHMYKYKIFLKV
jgi:predicted acyltransferase